MQWQRLFSIIRVQDEDLDDEDDEDLEDDIDDGDDGKETDDEEEEEDEEGEEPWQVQRGLTSGPEAPTLAPFPT